MITADIIMVSRPADDDVEDDYGDMEHWGRFQFAGLPVVGSAFSVWRMRKLVGVVVTDVRHEPVPIEPAPEHCAVWPPEDRLPNVRLTVRPE
jgi:hypothetical protein